MSDMMNMLEELQKSVKIASHIKELSGASGEFFAMLLIADLDTIERHILDGMNKYEELKKVRKDLPEVNMKRIGDKAALIGCLMRFRDDLAVNTMVGRECKAKYESMKNDLSV